MSNAILESDAPIGAATKRTRKAVVAGASDQLNAKQRRIVASIRDGDCIVDEATSNRPAHEHKKALPQAEGEDPKRAAHVNSIWERLEARSPNRRRDDEE